ncbi:hypothetical protein [Kitasatospora sp. NPDC087314]|uniref:hypothetical protein n=1 Tax=Kitasatospora sp. NPDC087314 TaxID=3364068 RepID=UPI003802BAFF
MPNSSSSSENWAADSFGTLAGPDERKASVPLSRRARRQRSTDRSLTRRSRAIVEVSPASDRPLLVAAGHPDSGRAADTLLILRHGAMNQSRFTAPEAVRTAPADAVAALLG